MDWRFWRKTALDGILVKDISMLSVVGFLASRNRRTGGFGGCGCKPPCNRGFESEDNKGKGRMR
jgi:hypothetical protein